MTNAQIGVIGAGIAGLSAAWMLRERYCDELLEKHSTLGGHTNTHLLEEDGKSVPVDTGFIVYNEPKYPNLTALFEYPGIASRPSDMSFAVSLGDGAVEYAGSSFDALYAQRRNLVSPSHQRMVWDILRFNRTCASDLESDGFGALTVDDYLARNRLSAVFRERYLLPMAAAIWSCPTSVMGSYPMASLAKFFKNHGLVQLADRPQWRTVVGGSHEYVKKMHNDLGGSVCADCTVQRVERHADCVVVTLANGERRIYEQVVLAAHADQSLEMIADPSSRETALLGQFGYQRNLAILHTDLRQMPRHRKIWSSWNYMADENNDSTRDQNVSVTFWMNKLQGLRTRRDYMVTLNPRTPPKSHKVLAEIEYHHPVFNEIAIAMQPLLSNLQGVNRTWFCGSFFGYGFHEDALSSSIAVARALGVRPKWLTDSTEAAAGSENSAALAAPLQGGY